jgi:predicted DNA-binding protein
MIATVRLDHTLEERLNTLFQMLHKKKSDIIREAMHYYANVVQDVKKARILNAVEKTKKSDKDVYDVFERTLNDGI